MDFVICGLLDIIILVIAIIVIIVGYKKGFIKKFIALFGILVILGFSVVFCSQLAGFLQNNGIIYPSIYSGIESNLTQNLADKGIDTVDGLTASELIKHVFSLPDFLCNAIGNKVSGDGDVVVLISEKLSYYAMVGISFGIIFFGLLLILGILKLIANVLRGNKIIRVIDGILGILFHLAIYVLVLSIIFFGLKLLIDNNVNQAIVDFFTKDMMLDNETFRLSKILYNGNFVTDLFGLFF